MKHFLITALVSAIIVWNFEGETDMVDDWSIVEPEERYEIDCALNEVWMECSSCERGCGKPMEPCFKMCYPARCQCPEHSGYGRNNRGECVFCPEANTNPIGDWIDAVTPEELLNFAVGRDDSLDDYHSISAQDMFTTVSAADATP